MELNDLKVQLEGAYEQVDAAQERFAAAARGLRRSQWYRSAGWISLRDLSPDELAAVAALTRKASLEPCASLLKKLERDERRARADLASRLRELGEHVDGSIGEQVSALAGHLPVVLVHDLRSYLFGLSVLISGLTVCLVFEGYAAAAVAVVTLGAWWAALKCAIAPKISVTNKVLIADDLPIRFGDLASVYVAEWGRGGRSVDVKTTAGRYRQLLMSPARAAELAAALRSRGVVVSGDAEVRDERS
ncbi:MAG: hypothetical protein QM723_17070 [Myxococcaceae bacterium]